MDTFRTKANEIKPLLPKLFKNGLQLNITEEFFKDYVNVYFRHKENLQEIKNIWGEAKPLDIKFDDRLNMFFLYNEYNPVIGFYFFENTIQIVPFNNYKVFMGVAYIIDFVEKIHKLDKSKKKKKK